MAGTTLTVVFFINTVIRIYKSNFEFVNFVNILVFDNSGYSLTLNLIVNLHRLVFLVTVLVNS